MKFGKFLSAQEVPGWEFYYLSYNRIKKTLTSTHDTESDKTFQQALEKELEKINAFYALKSDHLYNDVLQAKQLAKDGKISQDIDVELDRIATEVIQLERFQKLNILGFSKLLKKHDKYSELPAKGWFMLRVEDAPFVKKDLDHVLLQLSETWKTVSLARTRQTVLERTKKEEGEVPSSQNFERKTTKYWVPVDHVMEVKTMIIKHLPIDVFDKTASSRTDNLTTSVYYDSDDLYLYHDRLQRMEGAMNLRMRTYGYSTNNPVVFVERKTHHDSWVGETSVKQRFAIKSKKLYDFLQGNYHLDEKLKKALEQKEMSDIDVNETLKLSHEIQELVKEHDLQPAVTTRYTRTAFQLGRDNSVRMSLDTDLHMIKEHGYQNKRWGRDLALPVPENEVCWFPYAILEVKLNLPSGVETPAWIGELLEKNKITMVHKFSKFTHGCAVLMPEKVKLLPTWLALLQTKPEQQDQLYAIYLKSEHATKVKRITRDGQKLLPYRQGSSDKKPKPSPEPRQEIAIQVLSDTQSTTKKISPSVRQRTAAGKKEKAPNDIELEDAPLLSEDEKVGKGGGGGGGGGKPPDDEDGNGGGKGPWWRRPINWYRNWRTQKRVQVPLKIDPKTFFANERTLLHWLSFLVIVQSIGLALMRFSPGFEPWRIGGLIFVIISLVFMGYAVVRYEQRRYAIQSKSRGPYSDRFGPMVLVGLLLAAVLVNIILAYKLYFANACSGVGLLGLNFVQYSPKDVTLGNNGLLAVQKDTLFIINPDDSSVNNILIAGDHHGVTAVGDNVYLANLYPPSIDEFSFSQGRVLRNFPLTIPLSTESTGPTAIAFIPISDHPEGGVFWVGSSVDGAVHIFSLPLRNASSTTANMTGTFFPIPGMTVFQALNYHAESQTVYGIIGQWLFSISPTATSAPVASTLLGFPDPTGIAVTGPGNGTTAYVSCASCNEIWKFPFKDGKISSKGRCYPTSSSEPGLQSSKLTHTT